jgi:alpha-L-rhamnosidase
MKPILLFLFALLPAMGMAQKPVAESLTAEYLTNPLGIDITHPRLSWKINTTQKKPCNKPTTL